MVESETEHDKNIIASQLSSTILQLSTPILQPQKLQLNSRNIHIMHFIMVSTNTTYKQTTIIAPTTIDLNH